MTCRDLPLIIEAAVSLEKGGDSENSLYGPSLAGARASLDAGASIIHHHYDMHLPVDQQIDQVVRMHQEILATHPHALIYPAPLLSGQTNWEIHHHYRVLAEAGCLSMIAIEMGRTMFPLLNDDGLPDSEWINGQTFAECHELVMFANEHRAPLSIGIYTPSMAYWIREYADRGLLPAGTFVKIWFGGRYKVWTDRVPTVRHALPPTVKALDAYLEALEGTNLPWVIAVQGDNILDTPAARYAVEMGGHIRVGEEDVSGTTPLRNAEMVAAVVALASEVGRPVVSGHDARVFLGMKELAGQPV